MNQMQVVDLSTRYREFYNAVSAESHEKTLALFAKCEELKEKAENDPIQGIHAVMSRKILMGSWAEKLRFQAMSFPEGHPEQLEKMQLSDALLHYSALN